VDRRSRFKKGSGIALKVPVIDLIEIGAGGGSIAKVGSLGLLEVGPESAGAKPGPVCYDLGGESPTVSDADLMLGYLNPDFFCGGDIPLKAKKAEKAIIDKIVKPLKMSIEACVWGIHEIVNENMAAAAKVHVNEVGADIRKMVMVAYGGAGPVHAFGLAEKLKIKRVLIPMSAGVLSAVGFFTSPPTFDVVHTYKVTINDANLIEMEHAFKTMEKEAKSSLPFTRHDSEIVYERSAEMCYLGQQDYVTVGIPEGDFSKVDKQKILENFNQVYQSLYSRTYPDVEVEFVNLKVKGLMPQRLFNLRPPAFENNDIERALKNERKVFFPEKSYSVCPVYDRALLFPGAKFEGPAIIEEAESTTVVGYNSEVSVDEYGTIIIELLRSGMDE
jgi:N-methylhydantoinase A